MELSKRLGSFFCCMKFITLFALLLSCSVLSFGQDYKLMHYQRYAKVPIFFIPGDLFHSSDYLIVIPDSVYNAAEIRLRRVSTPQFKKRFESLFYVDQGSYTQVYYSIRGRRNFEKLLLKLSDRMTGSISGAQGTRWLSINGVEYQTVVSKERSTYAILIKKE